MKTASMASALLLSAAFVWAQAPPSEPAQSQTPPGAPQAPATGDKDDKNKKKMTAEIVATDAVAKTITVKNLAMAGSSTSPSAGGAPVTLRLEDKAQDRVSSLKSGDKVTLTCKAASSTDAPSNPPSAGSPASAGCQSVTDISKSLY